MPTARDCHNTRLPGEIKGDSAGAASAEQLRRVRGLTEVEREGRGASWRDVWGLVDMVSKDKQRNGGS